MSSVLSGSGLRAVVVLAAVALILVIGSVLSARIAPQAGVPSIPIKAGDPNEVAETGRPLELVQKPPARTVEAIPRPVGGEALSFDAVLQPYGIGTGGTIVARLGEVKPRMEAGTGGAEFARELSGRNVVLTVLPAAREVVESGGSYRAVLVVEDSAQGARLVMTEARR